MLTVTSEWALPGVPEGGTFVAQQVDWIRRTGVHVDVEPFRSAMKPRNYLEVRRRVNRRLRTGMYDIVHGHFGQSGLAVFGVPVPVVITFHGSDLLGIVGPRGNYQIRGRVLRRISRFVARRADAVIVTAQILARQLPKDVPYSIIPMTADPEVFGPGPQDEARRTLGLPLDRKIVLFAARPEVARKRFALAKGAVDLLRADDVDLITLFGRPPSEVATYMQASDALIVTSLHESGPVVVKEALRCRLPVVSVEVGDVKETIGGIEGCAVTSDDSPAALSAALGQVLRRGGRLDGSENEPVLDQERLAAKVVAIYEQVLRHRADTSRVSGG